MDRPLFVATLTILSLLMGSPFSRAADVPDTEAAARKKTWLTSEFRCRAISTMKLRTCRFKQKDDKVIISFPHADISCAVEFDEQGNPARLVGCRSAWLKIPKTAKLRKSKRRPVWSGGHRGWKWPDSGEEYCCPGMWIVAPKGRKDPEQETEKTRRKPGPRAPATR